MTVGLVMVRDRTGALAGSLSGFDQLQYRDALNGPGGWQLTLGSDHPVADLLASPGAGIVVFDDDEAPLFSGPVLPSGAGAAGVKTVTSGRSTVTVHGVSDLTCLWWRAIVPPSGRSHETTSGVFGVAAGAMVGRQIRLPGWGAAETTVGTIVTLTGRYVSLGDLICGEAAAQGVAAVARWSSGQVLFRVEAFTATAIPISVDAGSALSIRVTSTADSATMVRALGQGEGAARVVATADGSDGDEWRQIDLTLDRRDLADSAAVAAAARSGLVVGGDSFVVELVPGVAVPQVGETAAVSVDGTELVLPVVESTTMITPESERTVPVFGVPLRTAMTRLSSPPSTPVYD